MLSGHWDLSPVKPVQVLLLVLGLLISVGIGVVHTYPPDPSELTAPFSNFSSARAMPYVSKIAAKPHPTGTVQNTEVRNYLIGQLKAMGFNPEVQSALIVSPQQHYVGRVHNIVLHVPGKTAGKALMLSAHYDSVHTGPGAADDGASVAAILETLRALKAHFPLRNDLICLFTDSEETGLLGADAFVKQHPLAKNIGLALNFEYRGNRGAFMMFETSQGNGKLVQGLADAVPFVLANSLMYEVYKYLPNDTDMSVFKQAGIVGMNFAAINGLVSYHTQLDTPGSLDQGTLQQEGEIMLGLVKYFGNISLDDLAADDQVYFDLPGLGVMHYPVNWVIPLNSLLFLAFITLTTVGLQTERLVIRRVLLAGLLFPGIVLVLALTSHLLWLAILKIHPDYLTFAQGDIYNNHWYLLAFVLINIGLFRLFQSCIFSYLTPLDFTFGAMAFWLLISFLSADWLPGANFMLFWPLAGMLPALAIIMFSKDKICPAFPVIVIFFGGMPGVIIYTSLLKEIYSALTPHMISVVIVCLVLLLGLLTPLATLFGSAKCWLGFFLIAGFSALVAGSMTSGFDGNHPRQHNLFYAFNGQEQKAYWLSSDKRPNRWTSTFFSEVSGMRFLPEIFGNQLLKWWVSPAPLLPLTPPIIENLGEEAVPDGRKIKVKIRSSRSAPKMKIFVEGTEVLSSKVSGQAYTSSMQPHWNLNTVGLHNEDLTIEFIVPPAKPLVVRAMDLGYGNEEILPTAMPATLIHSPTEFSNTVIAVNTRFYNSR